jgi:hypothetical protein
MSKSRIALALTFLVFALTAYAPSAWAQAGVTSFQINVPVKNTLPQRPITTLKISVTLDSEPAMGTPVGFRITDNEGRTQDTGNLFPGASAFLGDFLPIPPASGGAPAPVGNDTIRVTAPDATLSAGDPAKKRYTFNINLFSNFNPSDAGSPCSTTMGVAETWTIQVITGTARIIGVCLRSFDQRVAGSECTGALRLVPVGVPADPPATLIGAPLGGATQTCGQSRPPVDLVMILDRSGSMSSPAAGGAPPKINRLREAVTNFINTWDSLRTLEAADPAFGGVAPADEIGLVFFDQDARWMNDVALGVPAWSGVAPGLHPFDSIKTLITTNINSVNASGATSIGDGLLEGSAKLFDAAHAGNGHRKVLVVMSNGMENSTQRVDVTPAVNPTVIRTFPTGALEADKQPLPNQAGMSIYTVTVGTGVAVSADINEDMAVAGKGFYLNTETDAALLNPYFQMILQNAVKFNTYETARLIHGEVTGTSPFTTTFPMTSTTEILSVTVTWDGRTAGGPMTLTLTPPGGGAPIVREGFGSIIVSQKLPLSPPYTPGSPWQLRLEATGQARTVPFDLIILADDAGINTNLAPVAADYLPGQNIRLQAKLQALGKPILNVGAGAGDSMVVRLVKPGQTVGDLLSDSTASSTGPAPEPMSATEIKLRNELAANPAALTPVSDTLQLFDDGAASHGDTTAGDGVYSGLYPADKPGHYNFLFAVEGTAKETGRFSRQQLKSVFVRSVPDADRTDVTSSVGRDAVLINMTPRTRFGNRMGPGWANYFWFTAPGITPLRPRDNLNGTYTATIPFSGPNPPDIDIHFIHVSATIDDSATPDNLPVPLNDTNVIKTVPVTGGFKRWGLSLHAGTSFPHGNFNTLFSPGGNFGVDLEYRINPNFSLEGIYTFHHFRGETFGAVTVDDINIHQFSINGKVYGSSSPVRPFFNFGGGAYKFDPGSTRGGLNVGGGVQFDVTSNIAIDTMYNFHNVFTSGSSTRFSTLQGGVRFRF